MMLKSLTGRDSNSQGDVHLTPSFSNSDLFSDQLSLASDGRIESLDVLRGVAVLGILIMNLQSFSMISSAYMNPVSWGDLSGINGVIWYASHLLIDSKFMALFSILFGAGIVLLSQRRRQAGQSPAVLHYRRMLGLFFIGMIHAYLFWYGDILVSYSICGSIVFVAWSFRLRWLLLGAGMLLLIGATLTMLLSWAFPLMPAADLAEIQNTVWMPTREAITQELQIYRGPWLPQFFHRAETTFVIQTIGFFTLGWRISGLMLLGMAMLKTGFLTGRSTLKAYLTTLLIGLAVGLPLIALGVKWNHEAEWSLAYSMFAGTLPNYFGSCMVAISYISLMHILLQTAARRAMVKWLAPVGRMALTNYLMQTIICTTLFYGHGFGLFGSVSRLSQLIIAMAIWVTQILFSRYWMTHHAFGPCEFGWRKLTYWKLPPQNTPRPRQSLTDTTRIPPS